MAEGPIQGLSIGLGLNTAGIDQGLKALKGKLKLVNSEMAANMSAFDRGEKSVTKYQTQLSGLNRKLDVQKSTVNAARSEYERMVAQHGEGSRQAERAAAAYNTEVAAVNNLERHIGNLTAEFRDFEQQQEAANSAFGRLGSTLSDTGGRVSKFGDGMKTVGAGISAGITTPLLGIGAAALKMADQSDKAQGKLQAQLGISKEEAGKLSDAAENLWKNAFGESVEEVAESLSLVKRNMQDLPIDQIEKVAEKGYILQDAFGADMADTTKTAQTMMTNFGISADEAFDLMTRGFQEGGDYSGELLDTLNEYSPQFSTMGHTAKDMMNILVAGAEAGAFSLDKVGDAVKEFNIRAKDGSDATADGFKAIGMNAEDMGNAIAEGGDKGKQAFDATIVALAAMEDPVERTAAGVALFGTQWEDLEVNVIEAMGTTRDQLGTVEGATAKAGEALYDNFGSRMTSMWRDFQTSLLPAGEILLDVAEDILPKVSEGVENLTGWFTEMEPAGQRTAVAVAGIAAAAGPVIAGLGFVASAVGGVMSVVGPLSTAIAGAGGLSASLGIAGTAITTFATGPIGIGIAAIAGVTIAGGLLVNHLRKDAIPEVDRFGDKVSEKTEQALTGFFELSDGASQELMNLRVNGTEITTTMANDMAAKFEEMNGQILEGMKKRHAEEIKQMETQFLNSSALTAEREKEILRQEEIRNDAQVVGQQHLEDRIQEILSTAVIEKRAITESEAKQIDAIREQMNENAVVFLSANEQEQKVILERMKNQADELSAQQAAAVVKNSAKQRDNVIADADKVYNDTIAFAIQQRDEAGAISAEEAEKIIAEAQKKRDVSVGHAEDMHSKVVGEAKKQAEEHVGHVDWETGEILSKWEVYKNDVIKKFKDMNKQSMDDFKKWGEDYKSWSSGVRESSSNFWRSWADGVVKKFKDTNSSSMSDFRTWGQNYKDWAADVKSKANETWRQYGEGVVSRFKKTNSDSLNDFKSWGGSLKQWAGDAKNSVTKTFDAMVEGAKKLPGRIGSGIRSMASQVAEGVKAVSNKLASGLGTGVNGVISGINWVLGKIGVNKKNYIDKWTVPKYAHGTKGAHPGGLMVVGDGIGSNKGPELIQTPDGKQTLSPSKPTLTMAPKGTKVWSAKETKDIMSMIPHYAWGDDKLRTAGEFISGKWESAKAVGGKVKDAVVDAYNYIKKPGAFLDLALKTLGISKPQAGSFSGNMAVAGWNKVKSAAVNYVKDKMTSFGSSQSGISLTGGNGGGFGPPFRFTSGPGPRNTGIPGASTFHKGWDWAAPIGTPIPSVTDGIGYRTGFHRLSGNFVEVKAPDGKVHRYQHNSKNLLSVGQPVRRGQTVGLVGDTGVGSGAHLHYEVKGFAGGGLVKKEQLALVGEGNKEEVVIPVGDRSKRTDAMKLLALAGKKLLRRSSNSSVPPSQMPNVTGADSQEDSILKALLNATLQQNQLLMQLINKDAHVYIDKDDLIGSIGPALDGYQGSASSLNMVMKG